MFPSHELPSHETRTPSTPSTRKIGSANEPKGLLCDIEIGHCVTRRSCARARAPQCCVLGKGQRVCALGKGQSMSGQPPPALTWARKLWWNTRTRQCQVCNCNFCCPHTFFAAPPFPQTHQCALATHRMCIHVEDDCKTLTSDRHPPQLAHIHIRLTSASSAACRPVAPGSDPPQPDRFGLLLRLWRTTDTTMPLSLSSAMTRPRCVLAKSNVRQRLLRRGGSVLCVLPPNEVDIPTIPNL